MAVPTCGGAPCFHLGSVHAAFAFSFLPSFAAQGTNCALYIQLLFPPPAVTWRGSPDPQLAEQPDHNKFVSVQLQLHATFSCSSHEEKVMAAFFFSFCLFADMNSKAFFFLFLSNHVGFKGGLLKLALFISWFKRLCRVMYGSANVIFWATPHLWNVWSECD